MATDGVADEGVRVSTAEQFVSSHLNVPNWLETLQLRVLAGILAVLDFRDFFLPIFLSLFRIFRSARFFKCGASSLRA